jgi:hypothetical protein
MASHHLYDPGTDTLLVELRPWPVASPAEVNEQVGGEDVEEGLVVNYGPNGSSTRRNDRTARPRRAAPSQGLCGGEPSPEHVSGSKLNHGKALAIW